MDFAACLVALSGACLFNPSNLTVEAGISAQASGHFDYWARGVNYHGGTVGYVGLRLQQPLGRHFGFTLEYRHTSLIDTTSDRGEERVAVGLQFRPF